MNDKVESQRNSIFISHRKKDEFISDMILDFLVGCGIPKDYIFCSSLPGNDVKESIPFEVRQRLREASLIILILSRDYYESAYCLNEAGVAWYLGEQIKTAVIGLPEISLEDMIGFLDSSYKLRRLSNEDDVASIYDLAQENIDVEVNTKHVIVTRETKKLKERYQKYIDERKIQSKNVDDTVQDNDDFDFGDEDANWNEKMTPVVGKDDVGKIPYESAFLLVYAAAGDGQIIKIRVLGSPVQISASGKRFMADNSERESARWEEALDRLIDWGWVKPVGYKGEIFKLTGTGYQKADWLKDGMEINTDNEPLEEMKGFERY